MANGHGGARPGSGPKRGPDGKALKQYQRRDPGKSSSESSRTPAVDAQVISATPPGNRPMFSTQAVEAILESMREVQTNRRNRPRTEDWNPYKIRPDRFGYVSEHIKKHKPKLAMDDNTGLMAANQFAVNSWQMGAFVGDDADMFLGYPRLAQMTQRSEFRLFGEIMSEEMTRKWIDLRGTDDESTKEEKKPKDRNKDDKEAQDRRLARDEEPRTDDRNKEIERKIVELKQFLDEIKLREVFKTIAQHDSDYGVAHLYLDLKGANIDDIRDPENAMSIGNGRDLISKEKLGNGCLLGLRTIEPVWCYPTAYNAMNPLARDFYDPRVWYVMGAEIHKTRLLPFIGRPVSDILKPAYAFGGLSMTQMAQPYVDIWLRTRESVGEIIHAFSIMILSTNMGTTTQPGGAGGGGGDVIARMMLANMLRDNQGMMVIDKNTEDFKNISAPLGGLDELQAQAQEHLFSVGRIPGVKYAGITPKGLNASSEGELRAFNDTVHGRQEQLYRAHLTTVLDIAMVSLWGQRDPDITHDFLPLYEETAKEKGEIRKLEAETDQIRIDSGVVSQEEVRGKVVADAESGYHGLDPDDVPDLLEEEEGGLIPEGAGKGLEAELEEGGGTPGKPPGGAKKKKPAGDEDKLSDYVGDASFSESDHPRSPDGKFGSGGTGAHGGPHHVIHEKGDPRPKASEAEARMLGLTPKKPNESAPHAGKKAISAEALGQKLKGMPKDKLEAALKNKDIDPKIRSHISRELTSRLIGGDASPAIAAGIVHRDPNGKVLLVRRSQGEGNYKGHWALPGGKADGDENAEAAARRENAEELGGRAVGALRKVDEVDTPNGMRYHTFLHETDQFRPKLNAEHDGFMWAHPTALPEPMHPSVKRIMGKLPDIGAAEDGDPDLYDTDEDRDTEDPFDGAADEWSESDHPRGQPNNAGQFGSGGGGSSGGNKQMGEREASGVRSSGGERQQGEGEGGGGERSNEGKRQMAQASRLYSAPTKTPDEIVAAFPGGAEAIARTRARLAAVVPTDSLVTEGGFKNPDGTYAPERAEIHRKIAASFFPAEKVARALPAPGEKPVLTMLGGRGGSGKSWLTGDKGPVNGETSILLDSDAIKGMLPGYEGWNASAFHEESTHILQMADARALELGVNAIHDATLKSEATAVMRMAQYEAAGYEVEGYYMYAAPETAATRAMARYAKGGKFNGRFVPPEIILGNVKNEENFDKLSGGFRKWAVYDNNSEGKGVEPKLVSKSGD